MSLDAQFAPAELIVLRTPLLPFAELAEWSSGLRAPDAPLDGDEEALAQALAGDRALLRRRLQAMLDRPELAEAIFLASPDLAESLPHWRREPESKKGQRSEQGLVRYLQRMASRPTPFGLFSGCTPGAVGLCTRLALGERRAYRRHSRLDMDYLFALCEQLGRSPELRGEILFRPNSSLYEEAGRLRYAEARLSGRLRTYHLVAVDAFEALDNTLARAAGGARLDDLAAALVAEDPDHEITRDDALAFLHDLVDNQVLLPELALPVTGEESTPGLRGQLAALPAAGEAGRLLAETERELAAIDAAGLGCPTGRYGDLARALAPLGAPVEMSRLFQVDLVKPAREVLLSPAVVAEILRGVEILHRVAPAQPEGPLGDFKAAFVNRYGEGREVPLLAALDEESGIGFERSGQAAAEASPLLAGLSFRARAERPTATWTVRESALLRLLADTLAHGGSEMALGEDDVARLENPERAPLPDAFHAMVSLAATSPAALAGGDFRLFLAHAAGPSGARLLGRFCHADETIRAGVLAHLAAEEALVPEAVFAEIVHLPAGRIGNVLARPVLRSREIPFLGRSGAPRERQIPADDLTVTVAGERIRLRSRSLGREIVPRLTNAHNTARESLGVYRFLAALQMQGRSGGAMWSWGPLEAAPFLPRVTAGRLVLARARWRLLKAELKPLTAAAGAARWRLARRWRQERRMPRYVALLDFDNELLLDFDNPLSLDAVFELIKSRDEVVLAELFPSPDELCAEGPEGRFLHEIVVPFTRRPAEAAPEPVGRPAWATAPPPVERTFPPGSAWLYAKLYTGTATADRVLLRELAPLAREALAAGAAERWFFLRYGDPDWHLRVRFGGAGERLRSEVQPRLEEAFGRLTAAGLVWRCQLDTYEREVERYGGSDGIELAEEIFFHDTQAVVAMLDAFAGDAGADLRWRLMLVGMDRLLADFGCDLVDKQRLAERSRAAFADRYRQDALRTPMADRLRKERAALERLLADPEAAPEVLQPALSALAQRSSALAPLVAELNRREHQGRLSSPVADLVPSFVHMHVNRLSRSAGPEHELVLYDFLARLYSSRLARASGGAAAAARVPAVVERP